MFAAFLSYLELSAINGVGLYFFSLRSFDASLQKMDRKKEPLKGSF